MAELGRGVLTSLWVCALLSGCTARSTLALDASLPDGPSVVQSGDAWTRVTAGAASTSIATRQAALRSLAVQDAEGRWALAGLADPSIDVQRSTVEALARSLRGGQDPHAAKWLAAATTGERTEATVGCLAAQALQRTPPAGSSLCNLPDDALAAATAEGLWAVQPVNLWRLGRTAVDVDEALLSAAAKGEAPLPDAVTVVRAARGHAAARATIRRWTKEPSRALDLARWALAMPDPGAVFGGRGLAAGGLAGRLVLAELAPSWAVANRLAGDADPLVRVAGATALAALSEADTPPAAREVLFAVLAADPDGRVRREAAVVAEAWARRAEPWPPRVEQGIAALAVDERDDVRVAAAAAQWRRAARPTPPSP